MDQVCPHCLTLHWDLEKLSTSNNHRSKGNDRQAVSFRNNTRAYNAANAFTSLGVQMDDGDLPGIGPMPFIIHGQLRH